MLAAPLCLLLMRLLFVPAKFLAGAGVVAERCVLVRPWRAVLSVCAQSDTPAAHK
jgi:putative effector of murein hydrolase LrgA (UPF0299 family)